MFEHGWSTRENVWKQNVEQSKDYMNYVETKYYSAQINEMIEVNSIYKVIHKLFMKQLNNF